MRVLLGVLEYSYSSTGIRAQIISTLLEDARVVFRAVFGQHCWIYVNFILVTNMLFISLLVHRRVRVINNIVGLNEGETIRLYIFSYKEAPLAILVNIVVLVVE
jgi:hypothetical protein